MAIDLLKKTQFQSEEVLEAQEMTDIAVKINEIIGAVNSSPGIQGATYSIIIDVEGANNLNLYFKRSDATATLTFSATTVKVLVDGSRQVVQDTKYKASVEVDDGNGNYVMVRDNITILNNNTKYSIDIKSFLSTSPRNVRIKITETVLSVSESWVGSAMLTTMSMTPANVLWENAYVDNPNGYSFGAFAITGNLDKTVYLRVSNADLAYDHTSSVNIGTTTFANGGYYFVLTDFPTTGTGVYKFEIWVASGTLESTHYTYNVMCVASSQAATAQLVCINNVGTQVVNGTSARLFDYAIYNGGNSTSGTSTTSNVRQTISATYSGVSHPIYDALLSNVAASQKNSLYFNVDINAESPTLIAMLTYGDTHPSASFLVDTSASFPATNGAVFYMNPSTRSNAQADRDVIKNASDSTDIQASWTKMAFVDGMDGWTVDDNGRSCLAINAGSKCQINYAPLSDTSGYLAIEINYKSSIVSQYLDNIITIASDPTTDNFTGIRIRPDEVCVHSSQRKSTFDNVQSYHTGDEDDIDLIIVFSQDYKNWKKRFCHIFVNGTIKCEFALEGNDNFITSAPIILGSDSANLYVYGIRVYNQAFGFLAATTNYVASLPTIEEKRAANARENDVMNEDGDVSYEKVIQSTTANWFIVEMIYKEDADGKAIKPWVKPTIPSYSDWTKKEVGRANLEMHFGAHPTWDWKINDVEHMGQGTTSMNYYRWNFRDRIDKTTTEVGSSKYEKQVYVQYGYNRSTGTWGNAALSTTIKFDGDTHSPVMRITAKKNYASSQQSHKMGTTAAYNDLHDRCVGANEGGGRTAVFQYPAYGFARTYDDLGNEKYEFIGLFTIGPDKGDKPTFKYNAKINNVDLKKTLMTMEGLDHDKRLAVFRYPWNNDVVFVDESLSIRTSDGYDAGWEVGNCYDLETAGTAEQNALVMEKLVQEWKPAYELAYLNSPFIMGLTTTRFGVQTVAAALTKINSDVTGFGSNINEEDDDRPYSYYEFYFEGDYNLYYLDIKDNAYKASGVNVLSNLGMTTTSSLNANILKKLGLSTYGVFGDFNTDTQKNQYLSLKGVATMDSEDELDAAILTTMGLLSISTIEDLALAKKDEYLREMRRRRFRTDMLASNSPWHLNDTLFCHTFLTIVGATDNHAKNSYPYKFNSLTSGGKWRWRQDDLDTIFDIDNQGHSAKKYSIEFKDWSNAAKTARVFKGEDSAFWTLIDQCFEEEIRAMGRSILDAMIYLGGSSDANTLTKLMAFFKKYYWNNAQEFFTKGAYNHDARYSYEDAYLEYKNGTYRVDVNPTEQSHGDSLESEMYWVERRMVYCMSKFRYGPFANYGDTSLGQILFRTQNPQRFNLTPAMDLYPCVMSGQGRNFYFNRTSDGSVGAMDGIGGGNTVVYIVAADYLRSIGDLAAFDIDSSTTTNLQIASKRLETLKIGDEDATKVSNGVAMLTFSNCPSLTTIDARNATNLSGSLDLSNCPRIRTVYLTGTQVAGLTFAEGSKLETLTLPSTMTALSLKNLKFLSSLDVTACAPNVKSVDIEGCTMLHSFQILKDIYYSNNLQGTNALTYIRITDIDETVTSAEDPNGQIAEMLYRIAKGLDADAHEKNYYALDAQGRETTDTAYISGTIHFETLVTGYASAIQSYFPYLTIDVGQQVTPSKDAIGLTLTGEEFETIYEDEAVGITRTYEVGANTIAYKSVTWSSDSIPAAIAFRTSDYTATLDFANFAPSGSANGNTENFFITATSTWNNRVSVTREIALARIRILQINNLAVDNEAIDYNKGTTCTISYVLNPVKNTKSRFVEYVYDHDAISIENNVVSPNNRNYGYTDVYARLSDDYSIFSNTVRIYLNDKLIINAGSNAGFASLLSFIFNTLKVSESATLLYAREASKVTRFNGNLKNKTAITTFVEFEYFTSYRCANEQGETRGVFTGCTNLESIKFPSTYTGVMGFSPDGTGNETSGFFYNCKRLAVVDFNGSTPTSFGSWAFHSCIALAELDIPSSVTLFGQNCFYNCTSLVTAEPSYATTIYSGAFNGCSKLVINNHFVNDVRLYGSAFRNCSSITSLTFEGDCTMGGEYIFAGCSKLVSINVLGSLMFTGSMAYLFQGCSLLQTIPTIKVTSGCTSLNHSFTSCSALESFNFDEESDFSNIVSCDHTFYGCNSIADWSFLENATFPSCTNFDNMFRGSSLDYFDWLDTLDVSSGTSFADMFYGINMSGVTSLGFLSTMRTKTDTRGGMITNAPDVTELNFANLVQANTWYYSLFSGMGGVQKIYLPVFQRNAGGTGIYSLFGGFSSLRFLFIPQYVRMQTLLGGGANLECVDIGATIQYMPFSSNRTSSYVCSGSPSYWVFRTSTPPASSTTYSTYVNLHNGVYNRLSTLYIFLPSQTAITNFESATGWSQFAGRYFVIGGTEWVSIFGKADAYADVDYYGYDRSKAGVPTTY